MKRGWISGMLISLLWLGTYPGEVQAEWLILKWIEKPPKNGSSTLAKLEDGTEFVQLFSYNKGEHDNESWPVIRQNLKEGDVIAYRKGAWEARKEIFLKGHLNSIGYRLLEYGHMAIVVGDPDDENILRLLSSEAFKGPNIREDLDALKDYSWDVYRLTQWDRLDKKRFYEFISLVLKKAEKWYGYDFLGMFGLWNSNLQPSKPENIGRDYICSTVILAALHYAGVELNASSRNGIAGVVTPLQLVRSKGRIVPTTQVSFEFSTAQEIIIEASSGEAKNETAASEQGIHVKD
ncbi:MAG: hypothetical protein ACREQA_04795 [Candidatus Binatia bacterium]